VYKTDRVNYMIVILMAKFMNEYNYRTT